MKGFHRTIAERAEHEEEIARDFFVRTGIAFGRMMQLSEKLWREHLAGRHPPGSELSVGPCSACLVPCQCATKAKPELDENKLCEWCCGTRRVTARVRKAQR